MRRVRSPFRFRAEILLVILCAAQVFAQQPGNATLTGRVLDVAGKPISKATLLLTGGGRGVNGAPKFLPYRATTSDDGSYRFAGIEPGDYNLRAERAGYAETIIGADNIHQLEGSLKLEPGQNKTGLDLTLALAGSISGTVVDEKNQPVEAIQICLWRQYDSPDATHNLSRIQQFSGSVVSDAITTTNGHYKLDNISPGVYYLSAGLMPESSPAITVFEINGLRAVRRNPWPPPPGVRPDGYLTTWFPAVIDETQSSSIKVEAGREVRADISLRKTPLFQVRGRMIVSPGLVPVEQIRVDVLTKNGQPLWSSVMAIAPGKDGSFELNSLPPGDYYVRPTGPGSGNPRSFALRKITIGEKDIDDLILNLPPLANIKGTLTIDGKPASPVRNLAMVFAPAEFPQGYNIAVPVGSDGSFSPPSIAPGAYRVQVWPPEGTVLDSIFIGNTELKTSAVTLESGATTMRVALRKVSGGSQ